MLKGTLQVCRVLLVVFNHPSRSPACTSCISQSIHKPELIAHAVLHQAAASASLA